MTALRNAHPSVASAGDGRFPSADDFPAVWEELVAESADWRRIDCAEYLRSWCGEVPAELTAKVSGVHHIGVYLGDYTTDDDVFAWNSHLTGLAAAGEVVSAELGPSYIAPRQYGTPGWWSSVALPDGSVIETFACRAFGPWLDKPAFERHRLMSHVALEVRTASDVEAVLDGLDREVEDLEAIAYTEADEVGHTYGHLRNNATRAVLEIVYDSAKRESSAGGGRSS